MESSFSIDRKAVFFDAESTIFTFSKPVAETYAQYIYPSVTPALVSSMQLAIKESWQVFQTIYLAKDNSYKTDAKQEMFAWEYFFNLVVDHLNIDIERKKVFDLIYDHYARYESRNLVSGVKELIVSLKQRGYVTGIFSNNDERLIPVLKGFNLDLHLDYIFPSSVIGFKKPSIEAFSKVLELARVSSRKFLYIGDDYDLDYLPCRVLGVKAWLVKEHPNLKESEIVRDFEALDSILHRISSIL